MDPSQAQQGRGSRMVALLLALLPVLLVMLLYHKQNTFLGGVEARTYDLRFKSLRGPTPVHPDIAIDDESTQAPGHLLAGK